MHKENYVFASWSNILKYDPGFILSPRVSGVMVIIRYSQWLVFGEWSHDHSGFRSSKQTQCVEELRVYIICIYSILYLHTCLLFQYPKCRRLFDTEQHGSEGSFFCQALKHSGRLIKSVPQAAAPIGSHTEKCSPSLSYITRKMRGRFEVHQSYSFFSLLAPSEKAAGARLLRTAQRRGEIKQAYSNCAASQSVLLEWVCPRTPTSLLFSHFLLLD